MIKAGGQLFNGPLWGTKAQAGLGWVDDGPGRCAVQPLKVSVRRGGRCETRVNDAGVIQPPPWLSAAAGTLQAG